MGICKVPVCERLVSCYGYCHAHYQRWRRGSLNLEIPVRVKRGNGKPRPGYLWCFSCRAEKPDDEMAGAATTRSRGRYTGECKVCRTDRGSTERRRQYIWQFYQLSLEEYNVLLVKQGGVCAICGEPPKKNNLSVDHNHDCCSGKKSCGKCLRGILCVRCNSKLEWWMTWQNEIARYLAA